VPIEFRSTDTNEEDMDAELDAYRMERERIEEEAEKDMPIETPLCSRRCSYCDPYRMSLEDSISAVPSTEFTYSLL
jgi:coproporphyrinogen III oxidase-like Fe-S oxidoreductase